MLEASNVDPDSFHLSFIGIMHPVVQRLLAGTPCEVPPPDSEAKASTIFAAVLDLWMSYDQVTALAALRTSMSSKWC